MTGLGALESGEAQLQRIQVVACGVHGVAILVYGAEQFAHGALESVVEPAALQRDVARAFLQMDLDLGLVVETGSASPQGALGADHGGDVFFSQLGVGIERHADLSLRVVHDHRAERGWAVDLFRIADGGGVDSLRGLPFHQATGDIEPMDREVEEHHVVDVLESLDSLDPGLVPLEGKIH